MVTLTYNCMDMQGNILNEKDRLTQVFDTEPMMWDWVHNLDRHPWTRINVISVD